MTKEEYWFWLCNIPGIGQSALLRLIEQFQDAEAIYCADEKKISACEYLSKAEKQLLKKAKSEPFDPAKMNELLKNDVHLVVYGQPGYPERFRMINDKPPYFYYRGNLPDPAVYSVGMVGARACSSYGKAAAFAFAKQLAQNQIQIISGMATGVDAWSSKGAIAGGGKTFVILGTGIDVIYPIENFGLYYDILDSGGGIITEFPPGTQGLPWQFPHRNRLISALSDKLLILEAKKRSGTLTTAQHALAQGVDIYALPGKINDRLSEGCNRLIADGCGVLLNVEEFLEDLYSKPVRCTPEGSGMFVPKTILQDKKEASLEQALRSVSPEARTLYGCLSFTARSMDLIGAQAGLSPVRASSAVTELILSGLADEVSKNYFVKKTENSAIFDDQHSF